MDGMLTSPTPSTRTKAHLLAGLASMLKAASVVFLHVICC